MIETGSTVIEKSLDITSRLKKEIKRGEYSSLRLNLDIRYKPYYLNFRISSVISIKLKLL